MWISVSTARPQTANLLEAVQYSATAANNCCCPVPTTPAQRARRTRRPAPTRNLRCAVTEFSHRRRSQIQLNDTRIGGLSYQQGTRTLWATGRHLRHKTGAPYITFLFSSLYLSRHDRGSLSCVVCRCVIRCTSSCAITTHSYHIPGRVRRWLPGKPSHASEQGPMGPHGRVGSPLSGLPSILHSCLAHCILISRHDRVDHCRACLSMRHSLH